MKLVVDVEPDNVPSKCYALLCFFLKTFSICLTVQCFESILNIIILIYQVETVTFDEIIYKKYTTNSPNFASFLVKDIKILDIFYITGLINHN